MTIGHATTDGRTHSPAARALLALSALALLPAASGCDQALKIRNSAPRVTAISSATPAADGLRVVFWVQDVDRDPVDIEAAWLPETACGGLRARLADPAAEPPRADEWGADFHAVAPIVGGAGQGLVGLTSEPAFPGRPHELAWDTADVDAASVCLYLLPDDREGDRGEPALSPVFAVADGFNAAPPAAATDVLTGGDTTGGDDAAIGDDAAATAD